MTAEQLRQWITEGRANGQTLVQGPDSTEWKPLNSFPEFAALVAAPISPVSAPGAIGGMQPNVPNYLWQAIVATVCCCPPLGIPAIVFAAQVNTKLATGDFQGAMEASRKAKIWSWVSFGAGLVGGIIWVILNAMGMAMGAFNQ